MHEPLLDVFITGTDAGVGKSYLCSLLASRALAAGKRPGMLKTVQTGVDDDARWVAQQVPGTAVATAYAFAAPITPAAAAALEHEPPPEIEHVLDVYRELRERTDGVLVEGSEGLLTPINEHETIANVAQALRLPLVIVCRPSFGTVNHTALTLAAARSHDLEIAGIVINGASPKPDVDERANRVALARMAPLLEVVEDDTLRSLSA